MYKSLFLFLIIFLNFPIKETLFLKVNKLKTKKLSSVKIFLDGKKS